MSEFEFDVDASIAAGWERFASRLAGFVRDLVPGATFDLTVPVPGVRHDSTPYIRFTAIDPHTGDAGDSGSMEDGVPGTVEASVPGSVVAVVSGGGDDDEPAPLRPHQYDMLAGLGWEVPPVDPYARGPRLPRMRVPLHETSHLAHLVAGTIEQVFGIPHPVFLHDVADTPSGAPLAETTRAEPAASTTSARTAPVTPGHPATPASDPADFRSEPISDPDQATRAVRQALDEVYGDHVESDDQDLFTVPAGCVVLLIRAHRSMPLIVFRSPLVSMVEDAAAAETEVAILNRDSLWCRYVFDGKSIYAESELVDRVFVPVNFKIQLAEISAELDDVYPDLARRVSPGQWRDLHSADDLRSDDQ